MSDRDKARLRGPVKSWRSESVMFLSQPDGHTEGPRHARGERYDPDGRLVKSWWRNPDGAEHHTQQVYDEQGLLRECISGPGDSAWKHLFHNSDWVLQHVEKRELTYH